MTDTNLTGKWWQLGHRPDYRFSLANERTFLAWIRTALALIAGAIGIDQFATHLGSPHLRTGLALALFAVGGLLGGLAYHRWVRTESAMRLDADVPRTVMLPMLTAFVAVLAAGLAVAVVTL
jgi:putative membrane protein